MEGGPGRVCPEESLCLYGEGSVVEVAEPLGPGTLLPWEVRCVRSALISCFLGCFSLGSSVDACSTSPVMVLRAGAHPAELWGHQRVTRTLTYLELVQRRCFVGIAALLPAARRRTGELRASLGSSVPLLLGRGDVGVRLPRSRVGVELPRVPSRWLPAPS